MYQTANAAMKWLAAGGLLGLSAASSDAHHSIAAMYAREAPVTVSGVVTAFEFRNPHPLIHLEVDGKGGLKERWTVEWSSRTRLEGRGYTPGTLKPGDQIVVTGGPARDGSKGLFVSRLQRPADGFEYVSSQAAPR